MGWVAGGLLITTGMSSAIYGLSELLFSGLAKSTDTLLYVSAPVWAMLHIVVGLGLVAAGCNIFVGRYWARMVGLGAALIVLIAGLLSFSQGPFFATFLVALNALIIWALWFHWEEISMD
jgi:hypothetical protein